MHSELPRHLNIAAEEGTPTEGPSVGMASHRPEAELAHFVRDPHRSNKICQHFVSAVTEWDLSTPFEVWRKLMNRLRTVLALSVSS